MKISKLFHWLYATLMFLPLMFFLPSCLYYGFNEHATNTETTTINYKYESNEVNSTDDLILGNIYQFNCNSKNVNQILYGSSNNVLFVELLSDLQFENYFVVDETDDNKFVLSHTYLCFSCDFYISYCFDEQDYQNYYISYEVDDNVMLNNCIVRLLNLNYAIDYTFFSYTDYNEIESVNVNTDDTISDKLSYSWQRIWDLPLFSWTHNSFVAAPFTYISGLFGVQANSTLNYVFTYFVSISICWLVFDLIMYVPNLAHRWLDKGALE